MSVDPEDDPVAFFGSHGLGVRVEEHDLHAEYMAKGEPGRASFFVEGRTYYCVDLLRQDGTVYLPRYGQGETAEEALAVAKRRFQS